MKHNEIILRNQAHPRLTAAATTHAGNGTSMLYIDTGPGYIELGPANSSHCHIQTDRTNFYFNKELRVDSGIVGSYDEDLILRRANNTAHQIQIGTDYIATTIPLELSHEGGSSATNGGRFLHAKYSGNNRIGVFSSQYGSGHLLIGNGMAYDNGANQIVSTFANFSGERTGLNVRRGSIVLLGTTGAIQTTVDSAITTQETFLHQTTDGYTRIGTPTGTQNSRIAIYKADNDVADHIIFYNGNTRVGEIGVLDNSWLRLNQTTANNIYTPRLIRADGGLHTNAGSATSPTFAIQTDSNTGMYSPGSDQLAFTTGGTRRVNISTSAINFYLDATAPYFNGTSGFKVNGTEVFDGNRVLKNVTRADFGPFTTTGTSTTHASYLRYGNISANVEGSHMSHPYFFNDLANFAARGGTVTFGGLNTTPAMTKPFDASPDFAGWAASNYTGSTMTLTLTNLPKALNYGGYIGIAFGNTGWAPASCKIEVSTDGGSTWTTRLDDSSKKEIYFTTTNAGASGVNAIRFTLGQPTSSLRLTNIWAYNYNSAGMEEYFLSKGGGRVWGDVAIGSNIEAGSKLKLYNNGNTKMTIECNDSSSAYINFTGVSNEMSLGYDRANSRMAFTNHDTLGSNIRMMLKSGGDWVVSNTDARVTTQFSDQAGIGWYETNQNMQVATTSTSNPAIEVGLNHGTSNAPFINFRKQGTLRGSISLEGNDSLVIQSTGSTGAGLRFHPSSGVISPIRNGSLSNETISFGTLTQSFNTAFVKKGYFHGGKNPQSGTWGGDPFVTVGGFESTGNHDHSSNQMQGFPLGVVSIGNNGGSTPTMRKNQVWTTGGISGNAYNSSVRWDLGRWEHNSTNSRTRLDMYLADQSHGWYLTSSWKVDGGSPRLGIGTTSPEDTLHVNGGSYATYFTGAAASDANRYRFYGTSTSYTIGMVSSNTFGGLGGWAMAFKFSDNAERGFVWRDSGHGLNGGAMAVTTQGKLTVAHSARIGYGETDTTTPGTYRLDVNGNVNFAASSSDQSSSNDSTSVPSTTGSAVMRLNGGYTDGRYATEFVKVDRIGNLPLYIRESTGTANSFSNIARFGAHSNTGDSTRTNRFYVFGNMGASGTLNISGTSNLASVNGSYFSDGYVQWTAAQFNRYGAAIEFQYNGTSGSKVRFGANGSNLSEIDCNSGHFTIGAGITATSAGISYFSTNLTNDEDWENSPISIRERGMVGSAQSSDAYAPNINFHWGGRFSKSIWINNNDFWFGEYSSTGVPQTSAGQLSYIHSAGYAISSTTVIDNNRNATFEQVTVGSNPSNAGAIYVHDTSTTAYTLGIVGTSTRAYKLQGSASSGDYNLYLQNLGTGSFHLNLTEGVAILNRTGNHPLSIDRKGTSGSSGTRYGDQIEFKAEGSKNGGLGYKVPYGGIGYRYSGDWGLGYYSFSSARYVQPCDASGGIRDNQVDLGATSSRFDDVYATNGTIQTSDINEKQDIQALTTAEQAAAVACKALVRRFRWRDSVEEKGDNARYHFGVIAQDVEAAFTAQGLDAGDYGLFIRTTWWEHEGDSYPSADVAPEGAVERSRLGIRYNQLLAFIISAL